MRIRTVEYRKLVTHGEYNNTTVGVVGEVAENEDPTLVLDALEQWVNDAVAAKVKSADGLYDEQQKLYRIQHDLDDRKRDLREAERRFEQAQAVLAANGIALEKPKGVWDDCHSERRNE